MNPPTQLPVRVLPRPEVLRRNVAEKLEHLDVEQLAVVHDWFRQMELDRAIRELGEDLASDAAAGQLSPAAIAASIQEHRRRYPYGG